MRRDREMRNKQNEISLLKHSGGYTLLEVLLAVTIIAIGVLGAAGLAGTAIRSSFHSQSITRSVNLAQDRIESLQSVDYENLELDDTTGRADLRRDCSGPTGPASRPVYTCTPTTSTITIGDKPYVWSYTVIYIDLDNNGTANPTADKLKRIDVTVTWTDALWQTQKSTTVTTFRSKG
jgi:type IV pilus assembly protein PilV